MRFAGKVAFVTGGGSGIGRAIAEGFASDGGRVVVNDLNGETAQQTVDALPGEGHLAAAGNVTDAARIREIFEELDAKLGRVDVLVNNAGVDNLPDDGSTELFQGKPSILHMSDEAFAGMLAIHVHGSFFCAREAARRMVEAGEGGAIVNMSSIAGLAGAGMPHYSAAKGALLGFTKSLARELGRYQIRVNAVCPGVTDTPMTRRVPEAVIEQMVQSQPLARMGTPGDIAEAVLYLASDAGAFVTGQALSPNGGVYIG